MPPVSGPLRPPWGPRRWPPRLRRACPAPAAHRWAGRDPPWCGCAKGASCDQWGGWAEPSGHLLSRGPYVRRLSCSWSARPCDPGPCRCSSSGSGWRPVWRRRASLSTVQLAVHVAAVLAPGSRVAAPSCPLPAHPPRPPRSSSLVLVPRPRPRPPSVLSTALTLPPINPNPNPNRAQPKPSRARPPAHGDAAGEDGAEEDAEEDAEVDAAAASVLPRGPRGGEPGENALGGLSARTRRVVRWWWWWWCLGTNTTAPSADARGRAADVEAAKFGS